MTAPTPPKPLAWREETEQRVCYLIRENVVMMSSQPANVRRAAQAILNALAKPYSATEEEVERAARAFHEVVCPPNESPVGGFSRYATWEECCEAQGFRDEQLRAMRTALATLTSGRLEQPAASSGQSVSTSPGSAGAEESEKAWTEDDALAFEVGKVARRAFNITGGRHQGVTEAGRQILAFLASRSTIPESDQEAWIKWRDDNKERLYRAEGVWSARIAGEAFLAGRSSVRGD